MVAKNVMLRCSNLQELYFLSSTCRDERCQEAIGVIGILSKNS